MKPKKNKGIQLIVIIYRISFVGLLILFLHGMFDTYRYRNTTYKETKQVSIRVEETGSWVTGCYRTGLGGGEEITSYRATMEYIVDGKKYKKTLSTAELNQLDSSIYYNPNNPDQYSFSPEDRSQLKEQLPGFIVVLIGFSCIELGIRVESKKKKSFKVGTKK